MLYTICIALILIASVLVILAVLVQNPKSGMAANFGASNQVMGVRETTNFLEKFTWTMAIAIVVLSLVATLAMDKRFRRTPRRCRSNCSTPRPLPRCRRPRFRPSSPHSLPRLPPSNPATGGGKITFSFRGDSLLAEFRFIPRRVSRCSRSLPPGSLPLGSPTLSRGFLPFAVSRPLGPGICPSGFCFSPASVSGSRRLRVRGGFGGCAVRSPLAFGAFAFAISSGACCPARLCK